MTPFETAAVSVLSSMFGGGTIVKLLYSWHKSQLKGELEQHFVTKEQHIHTTRQSDINHAAILMQQGKVEEVTARVARQDARIEDKLIDTLDEMKASLARTEKDNRKMFKTLTLHAVALEALCREKGIRIPRIEEEGE